MNIEKLLTEYFYRIYIYLRRKSSGFEDTFDMVGNNISHTLSKYQLKKEKKAARKNRKNKKQEIRDYIEFTSNRSNIIKEHNDSILESGKVHRNSYV